MDARRPFAYRPVVALAGVLLFTIAACSPTDGASSAAVIPAGRWSSASLAPRFSPTLAPVAGNVVAWAGTILDADQFAVAGGIVLADGRWHTIPGHSGDAGLLSAAGVAVGDRLVVVGTPCGASYQDPDASNEEGKDLRRGGVAPVADVTDVKRRSYERVPMSDKILRAVAYRRGVGPSGRERVVGWAIGATADSAYFMVVNKRVSRLVSFRPTTSTWTLIPATPGVGARDGNARTCVSGERVLSVDPSTSQRVVVVRGYSGRRWSVVSRSVLPAGVINHGVHCGGGVPLVLGYRPADRATTVLAYDIRRRRWHELPDPPTVGYIEDALEIADGTVVLWPSEPPDYLVLRAGASRWIRVRKPPPYDRQTPDSVLRAGQRLVLNPGVVGPGSLPLVVMDPVAAARHSTR